MAAVKEQILLSHPDKQVLLSEVPAMNSCDSSHPTVTLRLLVELCSDYGAGPVDVDTMEDVTCCVSLSDMGRCEGGADRAFKELVARIGNPTLRPEVAAQARFAAARVQARCGEEHDELAGVEFRLRVVFIDDEFKEESESESDLEDDDESGSDMDFREFDMSGARSVHYEQSVAGKDDDDEDGCGASSRCVPDSEFLMRG